MKYLIKSICLFLFFTSFFHASAQYSPLNVIIKESNGNVAAHATDGVKLTNSTLPYNYLWKLDGKLIDGKTDSTFFKCDLNTLLKEKEPKKTIKYGRLYNWYATQGAGDKSIVPEGWHVPTDLEWSLLTDYVGGPTKAGAKLKEIGTTYWKGANSEATNEVGFCARPGGLLTGNTFSSISDLGSWWSSTADNTYNGLSRKLTYSDNAEITESIDKNNGKSIRCIKDAKSKVFAFCAPLDFDPTMQPVNIIDVFNEYQNPDKKYIVSFRDDLDKLALTQGTNVAYGYEIDGVKHVDNYNVVQTALNGTLAAGNYTEIPVASTSGFPESGIIRYYDTGTYYYNFERFHIFRYTSKTPTSFIGESQPITEATGNILPVIDLVGTNRYLIVNSPTLENVELFDNNGAKNVQLPGITSGVSVAAFNCFEWLYCGKSINHIAGGNCGIGYGSVKYIHLENETQLTLLGYTDFYGVPLTGELNIPKSITSIGSNAGYNYWVGFGAGYLTKVTIGQNVTMIVDNFNSHNTIQRFDCYPLVAPRIIDVGAFMSNYPVPLHIRKDATGYDVSPWNDTNVFSEIIRDLNPIRDEDFVSLTDSTVTDIDGNVYKTLAIGSQIWMAQNLATTRYRNGDPILQNFSGSADAVSAYNNDKNNVFDISKTYDLSVSTTDQNSATATDMLAITPADSLLVNITDLIAITTYGGRGTLVAHAQGGEKLIDNGLPYTYSWKLNGVVIDGKTDSILSDIPAGNYSVEITDNCGNIAKDSFTLQAKLEVKLNESNGVIAAHATGGIRLAGNLPYNYTWKLDGEVIAGQTDSTITRCDLNSILKGRTLKEITTKSIKYGRLYNWYAATDPRRIAPDGWHVPTQKEWVTLINYCGGIHIAGIKLRSPELWNTSTYHYVRGTDDYNFKAYAGGYYTGGYSYLGQSAEFGCSDATIGDINFGTVGKRIILMPDYEQYGVGGFQISNNWLLYSLASIRLVKDNNINEGDVVIDGNTYNTVTIGNQVWTSQNLAVKHYQNGDLISSDLSGIVGAVTSYDNDESNVYDTKVTTSKTFDLSVTISDQNANTAKESLARLPQDSLSVNITDSITIPAYGDKGTLLAHAKGGLKKFNSSLPYSYRWKRNGVVLADKTDSVLADIPAGNYSVETTDYCGNIITDSLTLLDPLIIEINVSQPILSKGGTGTLVAKGKGGLKFKTGLPYQYHWYKGDFETELDGQTDSILSDVSAGTYSVEIMDSTENWADISFTLTQPEKLEVRIDESQSLPSNNGTGSLIANVTGGVKPYNYTWYKDGEVLNGKADATLSNIPAGNYSVQITDSNRITVSSSFTFIKHDPLKVTIVESNAMTYKGSVGTLVALASGGVKQDNNSAYNYNYSWKLNGEVIEGETDSVISLCQLNSYLNDKRPAATTLHPRWNDSGDLAIYGTDRFGFGALPSSWRRASNGTFGSFGDVDWMWLSIPSIVYMDSSSSAIYITPKSNAAGCSIRAVRSATTPEQPLPDGTIIPNAYTDYDGNVYAGTKIGLQVWTITNLKTTHYVDGTLIPTNLSDVAWAADTDGACAVYGKNDGAFVPTNELTTEALMVASYGRLYNFYAVDNAHGLIDTIDGWHVPTDAEFTQLSDYLITTYSDITNDNVGDALKSVRQVNSPFLFCNADNNLSVTVTDNNAATAENTYTLTKPEALEVGITASASILCYGGKGTLVATAKGGVKLIGKSTLYNYVWSLNGKVIDGKTDSILSEAVAGKYKVEITDNCGNIASNIFSLTQPEKLEVKVSESTPLLNNEGTSTLVAHGRGGVKFGTEYPYKYQWFKEDVKLDDKTDSTLLDVPTGKYTVQITDANNITASFLFTLIQHEELKVQISKSINNNGDSILVTHSTGGVKLDNNLPYNYSYNWDVNGEKIEGETDSIISLCNLYKYLNGKEPATITKKTIKYGRLYNRSATTDNRGIAPVGWHIPTTIEWDALSIYLGGNANSGGKLKESGLTYWNSPNSGATNINNFKARGSGGCSTVSSITYFSAKKMYFYAWCSGSNIDDNRIVYISYDSEVFTNNIYHTGNYGVAIRLIKDNSINEGDIIIDGDTYHSVTIGNQVWLQQNLAVKHYQNGDLIGSDFSGTEGAVTAYNNDESNVYGTVETKGNKFDIGVTITDKNAATATNSLAITRPDSLEVKVSVLNGILANGGKGSLVAHVSGGVKSTPVNPYNYSWFLNGSVLVGKSDSILSDIGAGHYSVSITDNCGTVVTDSFTLFQPDKLEVEIIESFSKPYNGKTGNIIARTTGGVTFDEELLYNFTWYKDGIELEGEINSTLDDVSAGIYSVRVEDSNGVTSTNSFTLIVHDSLKVEINKSVNSEDDGIIIANVTGGAKLDSNMPYNYSWSLNGEKLEGKTDSVLSSCELYNYLNVKFPIATIKPTILQGYIYNGYAKNDTRLITSSNDWEVASVARNSTMPHIGWDILIDYCGTNSLKYLSSGTNDYGFNALPNGARWNNGEFWSDSQSSIFLYGGFSGYLMGKFFSTNGSIYTGDLINDGAGSAIRLVRENTTLLNGDKGTYIGNDGFIYPTICIGSQEWMSCNLMETKYRNGDLIPTVTDKTEWSALRTGGKCAYNNDENNVFDSGNNFNLSVKITDKNAVTATNSLETNRLESLEVKVSDLNAILVNGGKGSLVAHALGGVKSTPVKRYNYSWFMNGSVLVGKSDSILSDIGAGHYSVSITDNCGTVATDSFTLSQPDKLEANINEITAIPYYGGTGSIVVHVNGGVKFPTGLPYSYTWYHEGIELADIKDSILSGVIAGNYSVRITDYNGNEANSTFKFMEPDPLKVDRESEYAITLSLNGKINTSQIMDSERNWSNIIFSNQAGNEIEDNCYIEKCKVPDFFYYKNNEDKWTISSGGNLSYTYGTVVKFNKTDTTYYDVNCHPNYIKIYTNPIPQKLAGPGYKVENTNLVNSINLIYPYYSDAIDNVYKTSVTNVAMSVSVKPRKFRLYMLDDNSEPIIINESIPLHSSDNVTLKASSGFPLELYKWEYGISTEPNVIVWKDINPDLQNKETLNFSPSDLINDSDFINIEDNGGRLFIRIKSESFEGNQIAEIIPVDKAPHFKSITAIEPSCTGLNNGKIEINFDRALYRGEELKVICDDGSGGDSYTVNSKASSIIIRNLLAGKYRLSLIGQMNGYQTNTDESKHLDSANIGAPLPVIYKVRKIENVKCYADSTGEVTFDLTGGTGTYLISYILKDSIEGELNYHLTQDQIKYRNAKTSFYRFLNNNKISGLVAGKYKFTINDTNQCDGGIGELEFSITEPHDSLKMTLDKSIPTTAFGYRDGKIRVKITGGTKSSTSAYKLVSPDGTLISTIDSLSNDSITQFSTIDNLYAGKHSILAIDSLGCNTMLEVKVSQPDSLIVTTTKTQPKLACHGGKGEFIAHAKGGVKPYSYRWYTGTESGWKALLFTDSILTDLTAGKYKVIVKDANKIEATAIDSIIQPSSVQLASTITNVGCKGNSDGSIKISLQGGAPPYTISLNNNDDYYSTQETDTSYTFKNLSVGDYYILVVDKNGCDGGIGKTKFSITQPAASLAIISSDSVLTTGYGKDTVNAKIEISGGTKPYKLTCDGDSIPFIYEDYTLISQLKSGNHILEVTDVHNCVVSKSMFVTQPDSLQAEINESVGIRCNGSSGELIAKVKGGVAPYSYKWLANTTFSKDTLLATNATLNNINIGEYEVIITDKNGNSVNATYTLLQPTLLTYSPTLIESVRCYGGSDGKASFNVAGGTGSYKIVYLNSKNPTDSTIIYPFEYPYTLSDLKAGTYHYTIIDVNGCNGGVSQKSFSIGEKSKIKIELTSFIAPKGSASTDGTIGVKITSGIQPYNLVWTDGKNDVLQSVDNTENGQLISKLSNLSEGVYKLVATDVNYSSANPNDACGSADTLVIDLKQPKPLELEIENLNPELKCHGDNTGMLIAHAKGGVTFTPPTLAYKYEWYRKTTTGSDLVLSNDSILQKSSGGDYYLRITDLNGVYLESKLVTINEPAALDIKFDITSVLCNKSATGKVIATPSGGVPPYIYSWNHTTDPGITTTLNDVAAGKYSLTITDKNGCSIVKNAIVEQPVEMTIKVESIMPTCYKYTDGQINVMPSGGVAPYSVNWKDGSATELKTGLGAGSYSFTVTDANGCSKSLTEVLTQPDSIRVMIDNKEVTLCVNQVAEYNIILPDDPQAVYQWYNSKGLIAETPAVILNDPDIYTAKIITSKGCKGQATTTIIRSNDLLNVDFVTASQVAKNKQVEIINITTPAPEKMKWLIPSTAAIKIVEQTNEKITLEFEENGDYSIGLKTFKGQCENTLYKTIKVVGDSALNDYQDGKEAYIKRFAVSSSFNDGNFKAWVEFSEKAEGNLYLINTEAAQLIDTRSFNNSSWYEFSYSNQVIPGVYILKLVTKKAQAYFKIIIH